MERLKRREIEELGAIGYADEFDADDLAGKHIDGTTGLVFETEEAYLNHVSPKTGHKPTEVEHQDILTDGAFSQISAKALERGEERKNEEA